MNTTSPSRWHDIRTTLTELLTWLEETEHWAQRLAPAEAAEAPEVSLAPRPLATTSVPPTTADSLADTEPEAERGSPDLFSLLGALTALRQEVKLQTRSARSDREQAAQALAQLAQAVALPAPQPELPPVPQVEPLPQESVRQDSATAVQEDSQAVAEKLMEFHDALSRTIQQAERVLLSVVESLRQWQRQPQPLSTVSEPVVRRGVFGRLRRRFRLSTGQPLAPATTSKAAPEPPIPATRASEAATGPGLVSPQTAAESGQMAERLEGLVEGYRLNLQRLERLLAAYDLTPIPCLGRPVDAELMEVVQVVVDPTQPAGIVTDEIRRGYRRGGRVYRFAQVVATRTGSASSAPAIPTIEA